MIEEEPRFLAENYQDLTGEKDISPQHVAEAVQYRQLDRQIPV